MLGKEFQDSPLKEYSKKSPEKLPITGKLLITYLMCRCAIPAPRYRYVSERNQYTLRLGSPANRFIVSQQVLIVKRRELLDELKAKDNDN